MEADKPTLEEIEVTPEMIEAGERALDDADIGSPHGLGTFSATESILLAALKAGGYVAKIRVV